ncbi:hypothetical protein [Microbacterium aurum]
MREPRQTAEFLTIVRAYHIDEYGRPVGIVPNRQFVGPGMEYRARSGVVLRARGTLYAHFERAQAAAVIRVIAHRLRASGYDGITFADPSGSALFPPEPATWARLNRKTNALVG